MVPLTTVTIVVEPILPVVPEGGTELKDEVVSELGVEVEGVGDIFEVEAFGVVVMRVGEDVGDINTIDVGVVLVGVDGSRVVNGTGDIVVLVFVI